MYEMQVRMERAGGRRAAIVAAAVEIADRDGLEAVSMRNLAERLGLGTMTLYSHVSDKDELVDMMVDRVSRAMLVPEPLPEPWRDALRAIAVRTREALERHPWITGARARRPHLRIHTIRHIEQSLRAVAPLDVDGATATAILMAVDDYVIGHAFRSQARQEVVRDIRAAAVGGEDPDERPDPEVTAALAAGELPLLAEAMQADAIRPRLGRQPEADFDRGLDWLLDGIQAAVEPGPGEVPPSPQGAAGASPPGPTGAGATSP